MCVSAWSLRPELFSAEVELEFVDYGDIKYAFGRLSPQDLDAAQKLAGVDAIYFKYVAFYEPCT